MREHLASKRRGSLSNPFAKHSVDVHGDNEFAVRCKILAVEEKITARKALSANCIFTNYPVRDNQHVCKCAKSELFILISHCEL